MRRIINLKREDQRKMWITYTIVTALFVIFEAMITTKSISSAMKGMLVPICAYMVMAVSLNLVVGVLGELSLGHAGFMSIGAFSGVVTSFILMNVVPYAPLRLGISMCVGAIFAAFAGFLIGIPVLSLKGDYLAIVTLAFGEIIKSLLNNFYLGMDSAGLHFSMLTDTTNLLKGGKLIIKGPMGIGGIRKIATFPASYILLMISLMIAFHLIYSRYGRAFQAIRDDRIAAESVGIDIFKYKMIAFVWSAALAGAAGCLFAMNYSTIVANKFDFNTSILILVFVVLGGQGNILGGLTAAALLTVLPEKLRQFRDYRMLMYAILLIVIMIASNNETVKSYISRFRIFGRKAKGARENGN